MHCRAQRQPLHHEPAVQEAMTRAEDYLIRTMHHLKRGDALCVYNTWAHTYVLDAMSMRGCKTGPGQPSLQGTEGMRPLPGKKT